MLSDFHYFIKWCIISRYLNNHNSYHIGTLNTLSLSLQYSRDLWIAKKTKQKQKRTWKALLPCKQSRMYSCTTGEQQGWLHFATNYQRSKGGLTGGCTVWLIEHLCLNCTLFGLLKQLQNGGELYICLSFKIAIVSIHKCRKRYTQGLRYYII